MTTSDPKDGEDPTEATAPNFDLDPDGPRVSRMRVGGEDIIVLSVPLPKLQYPEGTTAADTHAADARPIWIEVEIRGCGLGRILTILRIGRCHSRKLRFVDV